MTTLTLLVRARVRADIDSSGVSQRRIAAHLELSQPQIWARIHGSVEWRMSELERLAELLDVRPDRWFRKPAERAS